MKISNKVIKQLAELITGDTYSAPYLSGSKLVDFFNKFDFDDVYEEGFPTRWVYVSEKIIASNGTPQLRIILEEFVDPRRFNGNQELVDKIANDINSLIKYDGWGLVKDGLLYKVADVNGNFIKAETIQTIGHEFINEQVKKCQQKISTEDFNGAITNARTLIEAILIHIVETIEKTEIKNDGNVINLWTRAKKALKIDLKKDEVPESVFQIISGLDTSINGFAGLSNNAGDRHATKFTTKRHHAKLCVNLAMTMSDFLIDVLNNRQINSV